MFELPNVGALVLLPNATGFVVSPLLPLKLNDLFVPTMLPDDRSDFWLDPPKLNAFPVAFPVPFSAVV